MQQKAHLKQDSRGPTILQVLRWTVALQCLGYWRKLTQIEETPLLHWMLNPTDIGGLGCSEATATLIQQSVGWLLLPAALITLWKPQPVVLVLLTVLQTLYTVAMWRLAEGFALQADWLPPQLLLLFPFATQLLRIAAPLGLLLLSRSFASSQAAESTAAGTMQGLRWATAIVFVAHGIEALQHNPKFVDLLIASNMRLFGTSFSESTACTLLTLIGTVDVVVAIACLGVRATPIMGWIAFWGALTACSRVVAFGLDVAWHETATRAAHGGVPLAILLWWRWQNSGQGNNDDGDQQHETETEGTQHD